jgi:hypothetical protein
MWAEVEWNGRVHLCTRRNPEARLDLAIHQARDAVTALYDAAGATAIFEKNPFERRFRDMHTACQQSQGRPIHPQSAGQILPGLEAQTAPVSF